MAKTSDAAAKPAAPPRPDDPAEPVAALEEDLAPPGDGALALDIGEAGTRGGADEAPTAPPAPRRSATRRQATGVKAGASDDNEQFNAFVRFHREHAALGLPHTVEDRMVLEVQDVDGRPVAGAEVFVDGVLRRKTYADGRTLLHPQRWGVRQGQVTVRAHGQLLKAGTLGQGGRQLRVRSTEPRARYTQVPLDVAFIVDTTGSMGDELERLRATFDEIAYQVENTRPRPKVRFGMVLYRDRGDSYVTRKVPFTSDVKRFSRALGKVSAGGGGDTPEDVQSGLRVALHELRWRDRALKTAFLVGDAPPHTNYGQGFSYVHALEEAAQRGIKITTIGASGLDRQGELVWRQIAQATMSPFVFLTYGETGDSEGSPSTVSHHVGSNWVAGNLDAIIVRMIKRELRHYRDEEARPKENWFAAAPHPSRASDDVLAELFERSMAQLVDYAVEPLSPRTPTVVLPIAAPKHPAKDKLQRRLEVGLARKAEFQLLESDARGKMLRRLAEQMKLGYDESKMVDVGKLLPARLAILGQLDEGGAGQTEMLLKLIRLETGEVLSLSLMKIDQRLL